MKTLSQIIADLDDQVMLSFGSRPTGPCSKVFVVRASARAGSGDLISWSGEEFVSATSSDAADWPAVESALARAALNLVSRITVQRRKYVRGIESRPRWQGEAEETA